MAQTAEQLLILGDVAEGLLCRMHHFMGFVRPPCVREKNVARYCDRLVKTFPDFPENEKEKGADEFSKASAKIKAKYKDYFDTLLDFADFADEAWKLLQTASATLTALSLETNPDVVTLFFNLYVRYCKLHVLLERLPDAHFACIVYGKAFYDSSTNNDVDYHRLTIYLRGWELPIKRLQEECASIRINDALLKLADPIIKYGKPKAQAFVAGKVFNIVDQPAKAQLPVGDKKFLEVQRLQQCKEWATWGLLVCPEIMLEERAIVLLQVLLRDSFCVTIFRDQVLDVHKEFAEMFDSHRDQKLNLTKLKPVLKMKEADYLQVVQNHRDMRTYLKLELASLTQFFLAFPGCLAPKLQMIFAIIHLARDEVVWYYQHQHFSPYRAPKKYTIGSAPALPVLISQVHKLVHMLTKHEALIAKYFSAYLHAEDVPHADKALSAFINEANADANLKALCGNMLKEVKKPSNESDLEAARLNWFRVSAELSSHQSGVKKDLRQQISDIMNTLVSRTRGIDCLPKQIKLHASFGALYWHRATVLKTLELSLQAKSAQSECCMGFLHVLHDALHNVHRICPEEQAIIGKEAATQADQFLRGIVISAERMIKQVKTATTKLRLLTGHREAARDKRLAQAPNAKWNLPGWESKSSNYKHVEDLRLNKKGISDICHQIVEHDTVTVYNIQFVPREYLYASMTHNIRQRLKALVLNGKRELRRPSEALAGFRDEIYAYQTVERNSNIDLSEIVRDVIHSEFTDVLHGGPGEHLFLSSKDKKGTPTSIHAIADWYCSFLNQELAVKKGVVYSNIKECFVGRKAALKKGDPVTVHMDAELYTDATELKALCTLIGPYGVRVIDHAVLDVISRHIKAIRDILAANAKSLGSLVGRFTEYALWRDVSVKAQNLDKLVAISGIVGTCLLFRKNLRSALHASLRDRLPLAVDTIRDAHEYVKGAPKSQAHENMQYLAQDVGIDVGETDYALEHVLRRFKSKPEDVAMFDLLPELFGIAFVSKRWAAARYLIAYEGHTNNVHCTAETIRALIVAFQHIDVKGHPAKEPSVDVRIQKDLERFLRCAAFSILHLNSHEQQVAQYQIPSLMMFLEQFVVASGGRLNMSLLEDCFPFTLLRSNAIQLYESQSRQVAETPTQA